MVVFCHFWMAKRQWLQRKVENFKNKKKLNRKYQLDFILNFIDIIYTYTANYILDIQPISRFGYSDLNIEF